MLYKQTVLVDVYPLRERGAKLPKDRLIGRRGHLRLDGCLVPDESGNGWRRSFTASLTDGKPPPFPGAAMMHLMSVTLTRLDGRGFVLTGRELGSYREQYEARPQAWFCVPVNGEAGSPRPGADQCGVPGAAVGGSGLPG